MQFCVRDEAIQSSGIYKGYALIVIVALSSFLSFCKQSAFYLNAVVYHISTSLVAYALIENWRI